MMDVKNSQARLRQVGITDEKGTRTVSYARVFFKSEINNNLLGYAYNTSIMDLNIDYNSLQEYLDKPTPTDKPFLQIENYYAGIGIIAIFLTVLLIEKLENKLDYRLVKGLDIILIAFGLYLLFDKGLFNFHSVLIILIGGLVLIGIYLIIKRVTK